jgi:diguanylate cyclase (GGDEF)-like protein/putative nucleotidyltransferase with HDIG domain
MTDLATPEQANDTVAPTPLTPAARVCVSVATLLGLAVFGESVVRWNSPDLIKYGAFLAVALFFSAIRMGVPGIRQPLSLNFLFMFFGLVELNAPETVLLAILATLVHCYWNQPVRRPAQVLFEVSLTAVAVSAAELIYTSPWLVKVLIDAGWTEAANLDPSLMLALRLTAATLALFLVQSVPMAAMTAWVKGAQFVPVWWSSFRALAYYLAGAALAEGMSVANQYVGWPTVLLTGPVVYLIFLFYRLYIHRMEDQTKHALEVASLHLRTIEALALAIEAKDHTTHDHLRRVQIYAAEMGKELGLTEDEQQALLAASMLHDIGKLAVPEHIISKPGRLTPEEFEKMKIHPTVGAEILERVRFPYPVVPIVRAHHEKWDGTGYPAGLRGEAIPIGARILAAVDCLDALASDRQYRRALPLDEAMKVVVSEVGRAFDPQVVDALSKHYVKWEKMANIPAPQSAKLSTEVKVERGAAPAAGFESTRKEPATSTKDQPMDFLTSIAAARQEVQALFEISQDLGNSLSLDETLSVLNVRLRKIIPHHSLAIWLKRGELLVPEYVNGEDYRLFSSLQIPVGQGLSGWVAETGKPIVNGNPSVEPGYLNDPTRTSTLRSAVAVPLEGASGILGVVALYHMERDAFSKDHLRILMAISPKIGMSIENALKFRQVESSATTDFLTTLPNARSLFVQLDAELARGKRDDKPLTVVVLDLDGLKAVNDRFGHLEGNKVLKAVAAGLKPLCREYDYVARMGGDEFVVLLPGMDSAAAMARIEELREVIRRAGSELYIEGPLSASFGAAFFPKDGQDAEQILAEADKRMYHEKRSRKNSRAVQASTSWSSQWTGSSVQ